LETAHRDVQCRILDFAAAARCRLYRHLAPLARSTAVPASVESFRAGPTDPGGGSRADALLGQRAIIAIYALADWVMAKNRLYIEANSAARYGMRRFHVRRTPLRVAQILLPKGRSMDQEWCRDLY
jgi:hypothetical protein